jgi:cytoskeleton protein RodZ
MSNIGQQFQEARSSLGYTIREVSDIIHIRAEYLGKMENNSFDIPLHTVYVRGFVRLYAKFLKLNPDEIVEAFNKRHAQLEFSSEVNAERESLGTYTLPGAESPTDDDGVESTHRKIFDRYRSDDIGSGVSPWMYVVGIGLVVILIFAAVFAIKVTFFPTQTENEPPDTAETQISAPTKDVPGFKKESLNENLIGLVAKAPIYVYVTQTKDNEILFSGRLDTNERKIIIRDGEISIACDKSENLVIEKGGLPMDLKGTTGKAQLVVD